jgi:hypothetical protein
MGKKQPGYLLIYLHIRSQQLLPKLTNRTLQYLSQAASRTLSKLLINTPNSISSSIQVTAGPSTK